MSKSSRERYEARKIEEDIRKCRPEGAKECRRILPSGRKCHAVVLSGDIYCYFHSRLRGLSDENRDRKASIMIPLIEDHASIQMAINEIIHAIGANKIDARRASQCLYGIQLSIQNLSCIPGLAALDSVCDPDYPENGEMLAPEEDEYKPPMSWVEALMNEPEWQGPKLRDRCRLNSPSTAAPGLASELSSPNEENLELEEDFEVS